MTQLKVSAKSNPNAVAGAFAGVVREHGSAEVLVVGAGALNQAVKAIAIARGFLTPQGIDLVCVPAFDTVHIDGQERTAIRMLIEGRPPAEHNGAEREALDDLRVEHHEAPAHATASLAGDEPTKM